MALQFSTAVRHGMLDSFESTVGVSMRVKIWTGAAPANCAAADSGTLLADITCPVDYMAAAAAGAKAYTATWSDSSANNPGTAAHFRCYESTAAVCHAQGTVTATGGGGDMTLDTVTFVAGQVFTITAFTLTAPHA